MKNILPILLVVIVCFSIGNQIIAQDDNPTGSINYGMHPEGDTPTFNFVDVSFQNELDRKLKQAIESGNIEAENLIRQKMDEFYRNHTIIPSIENRDFQAFTGPDPSSNPDWLSNDILVYNGDIGVVNSGHKRIDIQMGEDGNLYVALIRRPVPGLTGRIDTYRSTNGGANWTFVQAIQSTTAYFFQLSMTVEVRSSSNFDSTRVFVFYSRSTDSTSDNATINYASFKRDGTGYKGGVPVLTPTSGNKLLYPSAVSDGQYWSTATYIGVTCGEYPNSGTSCINLHFARTTNWGDSYTTAVINDGYPTWNDFYPVAAFKSDTADSLYIAVERRFSAQPSVIRILATTWAPSSGFNRYSIPLSSTEDYTKPEITIVQDALSIPKKIVVACIKGGQAVYHRSMDGGVSWILDSQLSLPSEKNISFVTISSDSSTAGDDYVIAAFQKLSGDTIIVRRGRPGDLGTRVVKPNQFKSSPYNSPKVAIFNSGGTKYSALAYTGLSTSNYTSDLYFDQENLSTDIRNNENLIVIEYGLSQNYPNPFNPTTLISYQIPTQSSVSIKVYDALGNLIKELVNEEKSAGSYQVEFNAEKLASGIYFYRIQAGSFVQTKKMMLVR